MWHWHIILTCCKPSLWHTLSRHSLPLLSADNVHSIDVPSRSSTHITNNDLDTTLYWRLFFKRSLKGIFYDGHLSKILSVQNMTYYSTEWPTKENILDKVRKSAFEVSLFIESKFKTYYQLAGFVKESLLFHLSLIWWVSVTPHLQVPGTRYLLYSTVTSDCTTM